MQRNLAAGIRTPERLNEIRNAFRGGVADLQDFHTESVRTVSATSAMTEALTKNEVGLARTIKSRKMFNDILREQLALQRATTVQWSQNAMGQVRADMVVPRGVTSNVDALTRSFTANLRALNPLRYGTQQFSEAARVMSTRIALNTQLLASNSHMMINWGKNVQWAGRQLMVGFTVPFMAFGVAAGAAAYQVDKELTRIAKVYDTTATDVVGKQQELDRLRADSMAMAAEAAKRYGVAMKDTLAVEAELAAAGQQGRDLTTGTAEIMRASTLGELDYQETVKASIALQSIYGYSTQELGEKFNYMNALENATNLSMKDMVDTIPRASGTMKQMGVTFEQTGVLMAAMKAAGIEAAQGANALKSGMNRILNPGDKVKEQLADIGINIGAIVKESKGNLFIILQQLAEMMEGMDRVTKGKAIGALFGTMQMNRITAIINSMEDLNDTSTQVGRAYQVATQSAEQWGATASSEMNKIQQSASGKFKRALETIKASLAEAGKPFLEIGSTVLGWIGKVVSAFNGMGDTTKRVIAAIMLIGAVAGPLIMIGGLIANMLGHLMKLGVFMGSLLSRTRIMTAEQRAQSMMSQRSALAWSNQATAAQALSGQLQILSRELQQVALAQHNAATGQNLTARQYVGQQAAATAAAQMGMVPGRGGSYRQPNGQPMTTAQAQRFAQLHAQAAGSSAQTANNAAATGRSFGKIAAGVGGIGILATTFAQTQGHANGILSAMTQIAFAAMMVGPMLASGLKAVAGGAALQAVSAAFGTARAGAIAGGASRTRGLAAGLRAAIAPAMRLLPVLLRFAGIIGVIATAGIVIGRMVGEMNRMTQAQRDISNSAEGWASALGYVYQEAKAIQKVNGENVNNYDVMAAAIRKSKPGLADMLKDLGEAGKRQQLINAAIHEGVKARQTGASAADAYNVVGAALRVGGMKTNEIENLMPEIKLRVKFEEDKSVLANQAKAWAHDFSEIANNTLGQSKWEGFTRFLNNNRDVINNKSKEAAQGMAKEFWNSFQNTTDPTTRLQIFKSMEKAIRKQQKEMWESLSDDVKEQLRKYGITTAEELQKAYRVADKSDRHGEEFKQVYGSNSGPLYSYLRNGLSGDASRMIGKQAAAEEELTRAIAKKNGASKEDVKNLYVLTDLMGKLDMATMSTADANKAYQSAVAQRELQWMKLAPKEQQAAQLRLLNQYRQMAGLKDATSVEQGFGDALHDSTGKLKANSDALEENAMSADDFNNARKEAMSGASSAAFSQADEVWNKQADAEVRAIEARGDRLTKALDARQEKMDDSFDRREENAERRFDKREKSLEKKWDGIMERFENRWEKKIAATKKFYDDQIKKIKNQIKAEQEAEDTRQRIFEAEKTRMERLADIANKRIDFNLALNTGSLDEAAKVFNDIQATQDSWVLGDAADQSKASSEKRIEKMNGKIDTLENARDKRLESLKKVEEAEKKALQAKQQREREALKAERDRYMKSLQAERERYRKGIEAQKAAIQEQTKRDADARRAELDRMKKMLDLELAAIRASTPRNKKEYDKQISQIEGAYKKYGVRLEGYGRDWTDYIGKYLTSNVKAAAVKLQDDIKWKSIGNAVTQDMVDGGFNMTTKEFMTWVTEGKLPKSYKAPANPKTRHTGGPVSGNDKYNNRGGRNWGTEMRRDESLMLLKNDEFVMNGRAHKALGTDVLNSINQTGVLPDTGGRGLGFAGVFAAALAGMSSKAIEAAVEKKGAEAAATDLMAIPGAAGMYGKIMLSAEQLKNAGTIMSVGKSMGASTRDLVISLMTAMQESGLRNINYGDRDSLGLFQQRPSMGWGTREQILNPAYAAKKFFEGLLRIKNRDDMPLTLAAQAVQRSAFPYAYAKWEDMARAIVTGTVFQNNGFQNTNLKGWRKPMSGYRVSQEWSSRHGGIDLAAPTGSAVYAANAGTVVTSADLRGSNPYNSTPYRSYGRYVVIDHGGQSTLYAHLSQRYATAGQKVGAGARIGLSGNTGNSTGPHLHFETRGPGGFPGFNPRNVLPGLKSGGFTMNDGLAMLHKNEVVLTAPLTEQLKSGIQKIDQGTSNNYNVNVTFTGPVNSEIDVERAVTRALQKRESRLGRKRSIGS